MLASTGRTITMMSSSSIAMERLWPIFPSDTRLKAGNAGANKRPSWAPALAVCVETSQGLLIEQLLETGVSLYPIAPVSSKAYRERKAPSGTKTDRLDAWSLADALPLDGHNWKALGKEDAAGGRAAGALP